jgi:hypothetical protein
MKSAAIGPLIGAAVRQAVNAQRTVLLNQGSLPVQTLAGAA